MKISLLRLFFSLNKRYLQFPLNSRIIFSSFLAYLCLFLSHLVSLKLFFCLMASTPNFISTFLSLQFFILALLTRLVPRVTYFFIQYDSLSNLLSSEKEFKCSCLFQLILKSDLHHIFGLIAHLTFLKYIYLPNRLYFLRINLKKYQQRL